MSKDAQAGLYQHALTPVIEEHVRWFLESMKPRCDVIEEDRFTSEGGVGVTEYRYRSNVLAREEHQSSETRFYILAGDPWYGIPSTLVECSEEKYVVFMNIAPLHLPLEHSTEGASDDSWSYGERLMAHTFSVLGHRRYFTATDDYFVETVELHRQQPQAKIPVPFPNR
jgi:hypothetical protein